MAVNAGGAKSAYGSKVDIHNPESMDYARAGDNLAIAAMMKPVATTKHAAITGSVAAASCVEHDCRGYNSLMVFFTLNTTDVTWTFGVHGATGSALTFVPHLDAAGAEIVYTTDQSGWFIVQGIPDYTKVVPTKVDAGASTCTVKVQPFNS